MLRGLWKNRRPDLLFEDIPYISFLPPPPNPPSEPIEHQHIFLPEPHLLFFVFSLVAFCTVRNRGSGEAQEARHRVQLRLRREGVRDAGTPLHVEKLLRWSHWQRVKQLWTNARREASHRHTKASQQASSGCWENFPAGVKQYTGRRFLNLCALRKCHWATELVVGDTLPRIFKAAALFKRYTNRCVRATSIVTLKKAGLEDHAICHITGHKNTNNLDT